MVILLRRFLHKRKTDSTQKEIYLYHLRINRKVNYYIDYYYADSVTKACEYNEENHSNVSGILVKDY